MKLAGEDADVSEGKDVSDGSSSNVDEKLEDKNKTLRSLIISEILPSDTTFKNVCGFRLSDLKSYKKFVALMYRPTDPASLGVARALFGLCMVIDVVEERGFSDIDLKWGDPTTCHFPLIHGMKPPRLPWTIVLYTLMWIGAGGIMLGFRFKLACGCFLLPYWYFFILDKMNWNNHSYLYGVVSILLWGTGANKYFSLDAKLSKETNNSVPLWNYFILKFQFFVLYFVAGLKKSSQEWLDGYSMMNLSRHWVFDPFKLFLTTEQIDFLIVHWFGFIFDLTVGFWLLFDRTRLQAMLFSTSFHLMNSRLFHIGMFPYVCLATMPLFCHVDWPRKIKPWFLTRSKSDDLQDEFSNQCGNESNNMSGESCPKALEMKDDEINNKTAEEPPEKFVPTAEDDECDSAENEVCSISENSPEIEIGSDNQEDFEASDGSAIGEAELDEEETSSCLTHLDEQDRKLSKTSNVSRKQKSVVAILLLHVFLQLFLPYSHFITKGYNNWVPGLYGYSWDMMVHSWDTILVVIKIHDNVHNEDHYFDPQAWVQGDRWSKHGDMVRQYAHCLRNNLMSKRGKTSTAVENPNDTEHWARLSTNLSIYIDVWCSLNGRFLQRVFNPKIDLLTADWHPFQPVSYLMPLLTQFSSYRNKLEEIQRDVYTWSNYTDVLFIADYPGMQLDNYIDEDLTNVTLTVLEGEVIYMEDSWQHGVTISKGNSLEVTSGEFHNIETISLHPACLMYTFTNGTKQKLELKGKVIGPEKPNDTFSILKEIKYKLNAWKRTFGHIADAFFHLVYNVPMLRRVKID